MSENPIVNELDKAGAVIKDIAETVAHDVVEVVEYPIKAAKVVAVITTDYPALKPVLEKLLTEGKDAFAAVKHAAEDKGLNWTEDETAVNAVKALADFFVTQALPVIEKTYADLNAATS